MKKEELLEHNGILREILENSSAATLIADYAGKVLCINREFEKISGYSVEEVEGSKIWTDLIHNKDKDRLDNYIQLLRAKEESHISRIEIKFLDKSGSLRTGILKGHAMYDFRLLILSITDITEQKEFEKALVIAKEEAEASERLKSEFIASMSHEFRTPINAIMGFADLMKMEDIPAENKNMYLDQIIQGSHDLLMLIGKIVTISRLDSGQLRLSSRQFMVNDRLKDLYDRFQNKIESHNLSNVSLELHLENEEESLEILGDPMRLNEVLVNLLENALKFTDSGTVRFGYHFLKADSENDQDSLLFFVKDTGIGIEKDNLEIIFDRFVKIIEKEETIFKGAGLGLSIAKEIVALFGGKIWLESIKGEGSNFYFTYPVKTVESKKSTIPKVKISSPGTIDWSGYEALVAEDAESNYLFIKELLASTGIRILRARDGKEALDLFTNNPSINLVIMDILMPKMDGYEATKEIRKIREDIPVVAQTAFTFEGDMKDGLYAGCFNDYIMKPYTRKILIGILSKYLT